MGHRLIVQARTLYDQVKDELVRRIVTREWQPGEVLKNEVELARELGVSMGTVRKAFDALVDIELFKRVPGKGTTVVDNVSVNQRHRFINTRDADGNPVLGELLIAKAQLVEPNEELAGIFEVSDGAKLLQFQRERIHRDRVFTTERVHIVPAADDGLSSLEQQAHQLWFGRDVTVDKTEWISLATADEALADVFEIGVGTSVLATSRIIHGYHEKVLEHRVGHIHLGADLQFIMGRQRS